MIRGEAEKPSSNLFRASRAALAVFGTKEEKQRIIDQMRSDDPVIVDASVLACLNATLVSPEDAKILLGKINSGLIDVVDQFPRDHVIPDPVLGPMTDPATGLSRFTVVPEAMKLSGLNIFPHADATRWLSVKGTNNTKRRMLHIFVELLLKDGNTTTTATKWLDLGPIEIGETKEVEFPVGNAVSVPSNRQYGYFVELTPEEKRLFDRLLAK